MSRRGSQLIEFALLLPLVLVLFAGPIDLGWYYAIEVSLHSAARFGAHSGARALQALGPMDVAQAAATDAWNATWLAGTGAPTVQASLEGEAPMQVIRVRCTLSHEPLIGLVPLPQVHRVETILRMNEQPPPGSLTHN